MSENENNPSDGFMSTMTFASTAGGERACDCDDCGVVPPDVVQAIQKHKRLRYETGPLMRRTQDRKLIHRDQGISVWNLVMPLDAEPLVEFASSHRLVWVKRLPEGSVLKSIGTGIIGSSDEEKSRQEIDWTEGNVYVVPSNGGKAVGWIYTAKPEPEGESSIFSTKPSGLAIFNMVKIPLDKMPEGKTEPPAAESESQSWVDVVQSICREAIEEGLQLLAPEDGEKVKEALKNLEGKEVSQQTVPGSEDPQMTLEAILSRTEDTSSSLQAMLNSPDDGNALQDFLKKLEGSQSVLKNFIN